MAIEHDSIADGERHEPKGISTASANQVYVSNGAGSGSWQNLAGATNTVVINNASDFPDAVSGVITLADNTIYIIGADITISDRIEMGANNSITGNSLYAPVLTYTGTGSLFTCTDVNADFHDLRISAASGRVFNFQDSIGNMVNIQIRNVIIEDCDTVGTANNLQALVISNGSALSTNQGWDFSGSSWTILSIERYALVTSNATFVGIDLNTAVFFNIELTNLLFQSTVAGAVALKGAVSSANLSSGSVGVMKDSNFNANITPLNTITEDDVRWAFSGNTGIKDTRPDALVFLLNNVTETSISTINTPVIISGTYNEERVSHFSSNSSGRITYVGEKNFVTPIKVGGSVVAASTNKVITFYIAKNGTVVSNSGISINSTANQRAFVLMWQLDMAPNDYIEVFVENNTDTTNVTVSDMNIVVN